GSNPRLLQSGKTDPQVYTVMWEHLRQGKPWQGEFINRRKDGSEYVEAVRLSPVKQSSGTVTHYLAIKEDITQRKAAEQQIHRLAYFDALTGLPNRLLLADRFNQALSMAKRQNEPMTMMFLDLDHFKNVNDTLGHPAGDAMLEETTRRLSASVRAGDTLSRQGGDEFVLLLPDCNALQAAHVAQKLMDSMAPAMRIEGHDVTVTLSIGIAIYPTDGTDFNAMSKSADVAMYRAKEEGRNGYRFFTADMQVRSSRTLTLESHLRRALERNELQLVYQPQVSLANGQLVGVEALLRWHHPTLGVVSPVEFIPMAESSGLILPIGEWVLRTAARQLKTWMNEGLGHFTMAVNLSAVQFRDATLSTLVASVLHDQGLAPDCLELELTESVAMSDPLGAVVAIDEINALGVHMAIDDFGTGYSSLSYLKRFKVDKLKIDKSFVQDITTDPDDKAIASAIISLASSLGLRTIAEGVETPGQLAWLRMQGCDEAQGYFFSPPVSATELVDWARTQGLIPG
ncbi:MAG: EAL domain-containing protein, partial [Burkholderiales bacterium]|nr:EAL domain-containing protein [Burkholderiales bacterium]